MTKNGTTHTRLFTISFSPMNEIINKRLETFREVFKPIVGTPKGYEGSTMLYVPYEEVIHYLEHSIKEAYEAGRLSEKMAQEVEKSFIFDGTGK